MAKKRKRTPIRKPAKPLRSLSGALLDGLLEARRLARSRRWSEALASLENLYRRYPTSPELLWEIIHVCHEIPDHQRYQIYCRALARITPNDPDVLRSLGGIYLTNQFVALGLQTFRRYVKQFPDRPDAAQIRQFIAGLEPSMKADAAEQGLGTDDWLELAALHEEVRAALESSEYQEARQAGRRLLALRPDFIPVLNNLSQVDFMEGDVDAAIAGAKKVLGIDPDNFQAQGNLTHYLCLAGRAEEARQPAERLKQVRSPSLDVYVKKAEAFTYVGDDQAVLEAFHEGQQAGALRTPSAPLFYHLAGVATLRLGDEKQARRHWRQALRANPGFDLASGNLADLDKPIYERHAPWPFAFNQWVPARTLEELMKAFKPGGRRVADESVGPVLRDFFVRHPQVATVIAILLERGDPEGRAFALDLALGARTPELLAALKDFALSRHGPDRLRMQAAQAAVQAGVLGSPMVRLWLRGEWQETLLMAFEISGEPIRKSHSPEVERLLEQARDALNSGRGQESETLLERARESEPDAPDVLNNLAAAYAQQGRDREAEELLREIHRKHPDYFFGRIGMANLYVKHGELEKAEAMLQPLLSRKRLHYSELSALCITQIQLHLARGKPGAARTWLDMWARVDPDNRHLPYWRRTLGGRRT